METTHKVSDRPEQRASDRVRVCNGDRLAREILSGRQVSAPLQVGEDQALSNSVREHSARRTMTFRMVPVKRCPRRRRRGGDDDVSIARHRIRPGPGFFLTRVCVVSSVGREDCPRPAQRPRVPSPRTGGEYAPGLKHPEFLGGSETRRCPGGRRCSGHESPEEVLRRVAREGGSAGVRVEAAGRRTSPATWACTRSRCVTGCGRRRPTRVAGVIC
jgi:hypothetical protein